MSLLEGGHLDSPGYLEPPQVLSMRSGPNHKVEEEADRWLAKSREGVTALSEKRDYLTHDQLMLRSSREILNINGVPDANLVSGLFRRSYNPLAGHRPKKSQTDEG